MAQYGGYNQQYGGNNQPYSTSNNPYDQRDNRYDQQAGNQHNKPQYGNPYAQQDSGQNRYGGGQQVAQAYNQGGQNDIEMGNMNSTQGLGQPPQQDPMAILNEASAIRDGTAQLERDIQRIKQLSQQSLNDPDTSSNTPTNRQLNALQAETLNFSQNLTDRIGRLRGKRDYNLPQNKSQVDGVKRSLEKVVQNYSSVVAECDRKMKEQIARQVRIVQPEATEQQIEDAANGREQVFASALNRRGQSSTVLRAVQDRQAAVRQLNEALGQLAAMFIQMNQNVVEQEVITQQLEEKTYEVKEHQEKANQELDAGIVHKKRANKNKRWCLLIALIILIIVIALVVLLLKFVGNAF